MATGDHDAAAWIRPMIEEAPFAIQVFAPDGRSILTNRAFQALWGLSQEDLTAYNILDDPTLAASDIISYVRRAFAGESLEVPRTPYTLVRTPLAGRENPRWVRSYLYPVRDAGGAIRAIISVQDDVTDQQRAQEQVREKEEQYRGIFEATSDSLVIFDMDGFIVEANPVACRLYGYQYDELIGLHLSALVPEYESARMEPPAAARRGETYHGQLLARRKDGSRFYVEGHASTLTYRGRPHILSLARDVTAHVQARELLEQRVAERTRELTTLLEVSQNVASTLELQPLLELILDQIKEVATYSGASVVVSDDKELHVVGYRGPVAPELLLGRRFPLRGEQPAWDVQAGDGALICADVRGDTPEARAYQEAVGAELETTYGYVRSLMIVPLRLKDRTIGALALEHEQPNAYRAEQASLVIAIAHQAAIAIENARLYERAQEVAALEERQRLARELHDSVSQALYGIALGARTARTLLDRNPAQVADPLDYVLSLAEAGLAEMRALIFELLPDALETEGLVAALERQVAAVRARHGLDITLTMTGEPDAPLAVKEAIYRIAQEALHNLVKHARAATAEVHVQAAGDVLTLDVADDGVGFDPAGDYRGHLGLRTMRERATMLGGTLEIRSSPGRGTRIRARIPPRRPHPAKGPGG